VARPSADGLSVGAVGADAAGGEVGAQTALKVTTVGVWPAPEAYRHPSMSPSWSVQLLAPTEDCAHPLGVRWKYCQ
jgi:hypothetical protein